jgi:phosphatidylserine decarboxylase
MTIAREGYPYIFVGTAVSAVFFIAGFWIPAIVFLILTLFFTYFFRDPERAFAASEGQVLSPADGKVVLIRESDGHQVMSIFLSPFDVHINRAPVSGLITDIRYQRGKFLAAYDERASSQNEQNSITIEHDGNPIRFVQIAGILARRIVCWKRVGETLKAGERIGLIKFGSRVDVYFPPGFRLKAAVG